MGTEKKYVKVVDDDIRKIQFKAKSEIIVIRNGKTVSYDYGEIMKMNRNYKKVDKKIWRLLKCKEIVTPRDFFYKV